MNRGVRGTHAGSFSTKKRRLEGGGVKPGCWAMSELKKGGAEK